MSESRVYLPLSYVGIETGTGQKVVTTMYFQEDGGPRHFVHVLGHQTEALPKSRLRRVADGMWCLRNPNMPSYRVA